MTLRTLCLLLPTSLTVARLCATPLAIWALTERDYSFAFIVFSLAGLSDALDGTLARWLDARTMIGSYLDPIADKLLLVTVFVMLGSQNLIPLWLVILVVFRDVLIIGAVIVFNTAHRPLTLSPALISKLNSLAQFVYVGVVLAVQSFFIDSVAHNVPHHVIENILLVFIFVVAVTTLSSGGVYVSRIFNLVTLSDDRK
ncbi:MAG: CDP-alcohol phosphatidyltransferase family protein [Alphaproteobacteria bacterium]|nr:CDP-alcohol phosphatidyltransferase family protein [Alphaproteobacteria bacterium]